MATIKAQKPNELKTNVIFMTCTVIFLAKNVGQHLDL